MGLQEWRWMLASEMHDVREDQKYWKPSIDPARTLNTSKQDVTLASRGSFIHIAQGGAGVEGVFLADLIDVGAPLGTTKSIPGSVRFELSLLFSIDPKSGHIENNREFSSPSTQGKLQGHAEYRYEINQEQHFVDIWIKVGANVDGDVVEGKSESTTTGLEASGSVEKTLGFGKASGGVKANKNWTSSKNWGFSYKDGTSFGPMTQFDFRTFSLAKRGIYRELTTFFIQ